MKPLFLKGHKQTYKAYNVQKIILIMQCLLAKHNYEWVEE